MKDVFLSIFLPLFFSFQSLGIFILPCSRQYGISTFLTQNTFSKIRSFLFSLQQLFTGQNAYTYPWNKICSQILLSACGFSGTFFLCKYRYNVSLSGLLAWQQEQELYGILLNVSWADCLLGWLWSWSTKAED